MHIRGVNLHKDIHKVVICVTNLAQHTPHSVATHREGLTARQFEFIFQDCQRPVFLPTNTRIFIDDRDVKCSWVDSNHQPAPYQDATLTIELHEQDLNVDILYVLSFIFYLLYIQNNIIFILFQNFGLNVITNTLSKLMRPVNAGRRASSTVSLIRVA